MTFNTLSSVVTDPGLWSMVGLWLVLILFIRWLFTVDIETENGSIYSIRIPWRFCLVPWLGISVLWFLYLLFF